ncbi:HSP20-like chaperone [Teratosphaeria nubilosa]|uniref:HSP20-like chaperone n=1 Tax=Teratosphaeria nubilosa TaxID=161662 RepID=A0A6G1L8H5_9PEZI|nr:HSP20-like chaperone [Teratosphaeria nubilosa]
MATWYGYDDYMLNPIVDHPHERRHQHSTFLEALTHGKPDPEHHPNYPDVDIRDVINAYLIEVEVPGIKDVKDIHVYWIGQKTLIVRGEINRLPWKGEAKAGLSEQNCNSAHNAAHTVEPPYPLVQERKIGAFRRVFGFPFEPDHDTLSAKLEAGLLMLRVPKKHASKPEEVDTKKVHVESAQ